MGFLIIIGIMALIWLIGLIMTIFMSGEDRKLGAWITGILTIVIPIFYVIMSLTQVQEGTIKVPKLFGSVFETYYDSGLEIISPLYTVVEFDVRSDTLEFSGDNTLDTFSGDGVYIERFDLNVSYRVNEVNAWAIVRHLGEDTYRQVLWNASRSAARTVLGRWEWQEAATSRQDEFAAEIKSELEDLVADRLIQQGVPAELASALFLFSTPEVRKILPPVTIREAGSALQAADIEEDRQIALTRAEAEIARRQTEVGGGVNNLLTEMGMNPENMTAGEVALVLNALAERQRAETFEQLVRKEDSGIDWGVVMGGSNSAPNIALPTPGGEAQSFTPSE